MSWSPERKDMYENLKGWRGSSWARGKEKPTRVSVVEQITRQHFSQQPHECEDLTGQSGNCSVPTDLLGLG